MLSTTEKNKDKLISNILLWTPMHGHTNVGRPEKKKKIQQFYVDTWCCLWDLPQTIADMVG